jgi:hypothetical protein
VVSEAKRRRGGKTDDQDDTVDDGREAKEKENWPQVTNRLDFTNVNIDTHGS